jgi:hypothetical protein
MIRLEFCLYIDPVSGSLLLQAIIASFLGCIAFFRKSIYAVVSRIVPRREPSEKK